MNYKEELEKIKTHIKEHQESYILGTALMSFGTLCYVMGTRKPTPKAEFVFEVAE